MDHSATYVGIDKTIHDIETYLGVLIGAVTFSGFGHRLRQAVRQDRRQAADPARTSLAESRSAAGSIWFGYEFVAVRGGGGMN